MMASSFSVRYGVNLCVLSLVAIHRINTSHENGIITLSPHLEISGFIIMMFIDHGKVVCHRISIWLVNN